MSGLSYQRHKNQVSLVQKARDVSSRLTPELLDSIEALSPKILKKRIPDEHLTQLEQLKLAERRFGGPRLTLLGRYVLML